MERILLYSAGDNFTLNWNPHNVVPPPLRSDVVIHFVKIEVYTYSFENESWFIFQEIASNANNSGEAFFSNLQSGPENSTHSIVLMAFRITPLLDSSSISNTPEYVQSLINADQVGIWSSVAYKVATPEYDTLTPVLCHEWATQQSRNIGPILVANNPRCPCNIQQARQGNSMFIQILGERAEMVREFFHPGAAACFISTASLTYVCALCVCV